MAAESLRRFQREARMATSVTDPHLVRVHEVEDDPIRAFHLESAVLHGPFDFDEDLCPTEVRENAQRGYRVTCPDYEGGNQCKKRRHRGPPWP